MRVLVTGTGLVGCHAAAELIRVGSDVILYDLSPQPEYIERVLGGAYRSNLMVLQGNVCNPDALTTTLKSERVEVVVHTAGLVGRKAENNPYLAFRVNAEGTASVAEACRQASVRRLVHISSLAVYDWAKASGLPAVPENTPSGPATIYGSTKVAAEAVVRGYGARRWLEIVILRLAGVYGYGHFRGGSKMGFILQQLVMRALKGQASVVAPQLGANECLYARDAARAVRLAVETDRAANALYNIGTGRLERPEDIAAAIEMAVPGARLDFTETRVHHLPLDVRKAADELGFRAAYDLASGMRDLTEVLMSESALTEEAEELVADA